MLLFGLASLYFCCMTIIWVLPLLGYSQFLLYSSWFECLFSEVHSFIFLGLLSCFDGAYLSFNSYVKFESQGNVRSLGYFSAQQARILTTFLQSKLRVSQSQYIRITWVPINSKSVGAGLRGRKNHLKPVRWFQAWHTVVIKNHWAICYFFLIIQFPLEDNCFTTLYWFLPYIIMTQS